MSTNGIAKEQVVVSMTSFPPAIDFAYKAIQSILRGSVLPDKLILYLHLAQFDKIPVPDELLRLAEECPIFEIRDCDRDLKSYKKLIPALQEFPDAVIVTVDDDVDYGRDMLKKLLDLHAKYPDYVLAHRAKRMAIGKPYRKWKKYRWYSFLFRKDYGSYHNLQTGVGGVLYPAHALKTEMADPELFFKIAPTTDDIWFWAMAVANGTKTMPVPFGDNKPKGLGKPKAIALKTHNFKSGVDRNAAAVKAILEKYPEIIERLKDDR